MPKITPKEAADKWARRTAAAVPDYTAGILRVTESPMEAAAEAAEKMLQNLLEAVQSGRWARSLKKVSLAEWKEATTKKGSARLAQGVQGATKKQEDYYNEVFPYLETIQAEIAAMPDLGIEDSIARSAHLQRRMHEFKNQRR